LGLAAIVIAVLITVVFGGGTTPPATGAASVVPADALVYVNVSLDSRRSAVKQALTVARRFPSYPLATAALEQRLSSAIAGTAGADFSGEVRPWLGGELAVAYLTTPDSVAVPLIVLDVSDSGRARGFLTRSGATGAGAYRGTALLRLSSGREAAFVSHYLVVGGPMGIKDAIDVAAGRLSSLAHDPGYARVAAGEPAGRVLDAYASAAGVRRVLVTRGGALGALGALLARPALQAVTLAISPSPAGARIRVHETLDPTLSQIGGPLPAPFSPTLQSVLPAGSILLFDLRGLARAAPTVLSAGAAAGIGGQVAPLLQRLGTALAAEGVNVHSLESIFDEETAVAITPTAESGASASANKSSPPAFTIVARTAHGEQTRAALAAAEVPLSQLFPAPASGPGQAPVFNDIQVAGVAAHQLSLTSGLQLDYAVFRGLVVLSTSRDGIAAVAEHRTSLGQTAQFQRALAERPQRVSSLLFLDFSQLLSLGEQTGLTQGARLQGLLPDLERVRAVGMSATDGEADSTAELSVQIP
jgi:hypothetical protein